jgi:uncharacterized membrane protein
LLEVEVTNTTDVIDGVTADIEGLDPSWVQLVQPVVSLFPDSTATIVARLELPRNCIAGEYLITVNVRSVVDSARVASHQFWLTVEPRPGFQLSLRPSLVIGGSRAEFGALVANVGNTPLDVVLTANEETRNLDCLVDFPTVHLEPGDLVRVGVEARGHRPWFAQLTSRTISITAIADGEEQTQVATFNQKPRIARGVITALVIAAIIALWAFIFAWVVGALNATEDTKKLFADHFHCVPPPPENTAMVCTGGVEEVPILDIAAQISGEVTASTTLEPLPRVTVEAYRMNKDNIEEPAGSTVTLDDGRYVLPALLPGKYKVKFSAQGYGVQWYNGVDSLNEASIITLAALGQQTGVNAKLTGGLSRDEIPLVPLTPAGSTTGTTTGTTTHPAAPDGVRADPSAGRLGTTAVFQPGADSAEDMNCAALSPAVSGDSGSGLAYGGVPGGGQLTLAVVAPDSQVGLSIGMEVQRIAGSSDELEAMGGTLPAPLTTTSTTGNFFVCGLITPATYRVKVTAEGFQPNDVTVTLRGGEDKLLNTITLEAELGQISGTVRDGDGNLLGDVAVVVRSGDFEKKATTPTAGDGEGTYRVTDLETPNTYVVTFTKEGYGTVTESLSLDPGSGAEKSVTMNGGVGTVSGALTSVDGRPLGGAHVVVSGGSFTAESDTLTGANAGSYTVTGMPVPGRYTVTFTLDRYTSETVQVSFSGPTTQTGVNASLRSALGSVSGRATLGGSPLAGATVKLSSGSDPRITSTATAPAGEFSFTDVEPGTYTVTIEFPNTTPQVVLVAVKAGENVVANANLTAIA